MVLVFENGLLSAVVLAKKVKELHAHELLEGNYQDCWQMEYP